MSHCFSIPLTVLLALGFGGLLPAQSILFHPASDTATPIGMALHDEIWRTGSPAQAVLPREAVAVLFGDRNGNGLLDDGPTRFDALATNAAGHIYVSLASNAVLANGSTLLDGDVLRLDAGAPLSVVWTESLFAAAVGASTVDIDAFAIGVSGEIYFSFEEDEITTSVALMVQNGGNATLDEQCVFRLDLGQNVAVLHLTQAAVVALFNTAFGSTATSVVDTTGLELDPLDATALWITSGSASAALKGRIVSTRNGGTPVTIGGTPFEPSAAGFSTNCTLDSLALGNMSWPVVRLTPASGSASNAANGIVRVEQAGPMELVQLVITTPQLPGPSGVLSQLPGWGGIHVNPADPLFALSANAPQFTLAADPAGVASYGFSFAGMTPGLQAIIQTIEIATLRVSTPAVLTITV
ncbi:MAG: hypothetical protein EXS14_08195 [Planctomycetes bacterium]|nr:hypothetical protein [Planctomycetota bacterium]